MRLPFTTPLYILILVIGAGCLATGARAVTCGLPL